MEKQIKYRIDLSDYDLETAEAMLSGRRYLYVGFMCHQTIEKAFNDAGFLEEILKNGIEVS
jgi:hypothetical protein